MYKPIVSCLYSLPFFNNNLAVWLGAQVIPILHWWADPAYAGVLLGYFQN